MKSLSARPDRYDLQQIADFGNRVLLGTLLASSCAALAIGSTRGEFPLAAGASALLVALGLAAHWLGGRHAIGWSVLTGCNVAMAALHVDLGRGTVEFHFGVFVLLGLLLVYRDWRPILMAATMFAVHHIVFDQLRRRPVPGPVHARGAGSNGGDAQKQAIGKMAVAMADVRAAASSIEFASGKIASGNHNLSQRTEQQAGSLKQTATSMDALTSTVAQSAATSLQATELAAEAAEAAVQGGEMVGTVVVTMSDISTASRRIADINGVIDGIAFQTNILALNAAVEAARAGEHGRGFAVVATEVRALARRSAEAAKEIKSLVDDSVERVERGLQQAGSAGASMATIVTGAQRVSQLIRELSGTARQQTKGISPVGETVTQLDSMTQQNAALVQDSAAAAESLRRQAGSLQAVVQRFSTAVVTA